MLCSGASCPATTLLLSMYTVYNTALIIISCAKFSFGPSTCMLQCRKFSSKFASRFPADQTRSAITCTWCTPHTTAPEFFISWTVPDLFWKLQELVVLLLWKLQMQIGFILSPLELLGWSAGMCIAWFVNVGFHRWESESEAMDRSRGNKRNWYKYHHSTLVEKERISWNRWSARGLQYYIYIYIYIWFLQTIAMWIMPEEYCSCRKLAECRSLELEAWGSHVLMLEPLYTGWLQDHGMGGWFLQLLSVRRRWRRCSKPAAARADQCSKNMFRQLCTILQSYSCC